MRRKQQSQKVSQGPDRTPNLCRTFIHKSSTRARERERDGSQRNALLETAADSKEIERKGHDVFATRPVA